MLNLVICKSKIFKLDIEDLEHNLPNSLQNNDAASTINVWQSDEALFISSESLISVCSVYDISGKCVAKTQNSAKELSISTAIFIDGIYLVNIKTGSNNITKKVIVK